MAKGNRNNNNNRNRNRRGDFSGNYTKRNTETVKDCTYKEGITVKELAEKIGKSPAEIYGCWYETAVTILS